MIPNPILKVLSTLSSHEVRHLLMGGQACVFYGAAEFSRDCDIVIVADEENLNRLVAALDELEADCIAVPPMDWAYLDRGHAIHFVGWSIHTTTRIMRHQTTIKSVFGFENLAARTC